MFSFSLINVEMRCATVSLRGLNRSWGKVSQAGNSNTSSCNSLRSFTKSSLDLLELVTIKSGRSAARIDARNGCNEVGAMMRFLDSSASRICASAASASRMSFICAPFLVPYQLLRKRLRPQLRGTGGGLMGQV